MLRRPTYEPILSPCLSFRRAIHWCLEWGGASPHERGFVIGGKDRRRGFVQERPWRRRGGPARRSLRGRRSLGLRLVIVGDSEGRGLRDGLMEGLRNEERARFWARRPKTVVSVFPRASRHWIGAGHHHKLLNNTRLLVCFLRCEIAGLPCLPRVVTGNLLEIQVLCPHPRLTESETQGMRPHHQCFNKPSRWF